VRDRGLDRIPDPAPDLTERLIASLRHRGPDGPAADLAGSRLIHTRLSIIDLSPSGRQPMSNEDGSVWIVFNVRSTTTRASGGPDTSGHRFRGRAIRRSCRTCTRRKAIVSSRSCAACSASARRLRRRILLLGRDRFGIKPLFFAPVGQGLASPARSGLYGGPGVDWGVDRRRSPTSRAGLRAGAAHALPWCRCVEPGE